MKRMAFLAWAPLFLVLTGGTARADAAPPEDGCGCNVGGATARTVGPWLLAGLSGLAVAFVRRRRDK